MTMFPSFAGQYTLPGMHAILESVENQCWFGKVDQQVFFPVTVSGATRDAGNTVTTVLRHGLLLGRVTATGLLKEWNPSGTDGSELIYGVLVATINAQMNAADADRYIGMVMIGGNLYSDRIIVPGTAAEGIVGHAQEFNIVNQLSGRFILDRHISASGGGGGDVGSTVRIPTAAEIAADAMTMTDADSGKTLVMFGIDATTTITAPVAKAGMRFSILNNSAQTVTVNRTGSTVFQTKAALAGTTLSLSTGESANFIGVAADKFVVQSFETATN